jgi:hypothetical protein
MFVDNKLSLGFSLLVDQPWPVASLRPSSGAPSRKSAFLQAKPSRKEARRLGKAYSVFGNHESKSGGACHADATRLVRAFLPTYFSAP